MFWDNKNKVHPASEKYKEKELKRIPEDHDLNATYRTAINAMDENTEQNDGIVVSIKCKCFSSESKCNIL
jgi:hypothetical protein